jgi:hypothetical protein
MLRAGDLVADVVVAPRMCHGVDGVALHASPYLTSGGDGNGLRADSSSACTSSSFAVVQDEGERHRLTCMLHGEEEKERERLTISAMILTVGKR